MPLRKKPRIKMVAPVRIWGMGSTGKAFNVLAYTLNVSSNGARIGGIRVPVAVGDAVTLQYKQNRALFKVVWLGRPGDTTQEQIGVTLLEQDRPIWGEIEESRNFTDVFRGERAHKEITAQAAPPNPSPAQEMPTAQAEAAAEVPEILPAVAEDESKVDANQLLRSCADGLLRIEAFVRRNPPDPESLQEFRNALAKVRQTVWALQQWHEVKAEGKEAFPLLSYLNAERVRFMSQAARDLADDVEHKGVEVEGALLQSLFTVMERLRSLNADRFTLEVVPPEAVGANTLRSAVSVSLRAVMSDALRSGMKEEDSMRFFAGELQRALRADGVAVARYEKGEMICVGSNGNAPEAGMVLETEVGIGGEAFANRHLVYCANTQSDARVDAELCRAANIGAVTIFPVLSDSMEPVGMVQVSTARPNPFGEEHLAALETAAGLLRDVMARHEQVSGPA